MDTKAKPDRPIRIELMGPHGSGKSTILAAAKTMRDSPYRWIGPSECDGVLTRYRKQLRPTWQTLDCEFADLINRSLDIVAASQMSPSQKIGALDLFKWSLATHARLAHLSWRGAFIHDELLMHRGFSLLLFSKDMEKRAEAYYAAAPLPDFCIIVSADRDETVRRVMSRAKRANVHRGLEESEIAFCTDRALALADIAESVLTARGASVHRLRTDAALSENAERLHRLILQPLG